MKIPVVSPNDIQGMTQEHVDHLCNVGSKKWSAVTLVTPHITFIIHNPSHGVGRQESNIMHELSHLICKHEPSEVVQLPGFSFLIRTCDSIQEEEADWVCGCLKLPRDGILWAARKGMSTQQIAEHFMSSLDLARYRLQKTGVELQVQRERKKRRL